MRLRQVLDRAGYEELRIAEALEVDRPHARRASQTPAYVRLLPRGEPLSALIQLFLLGVPVGREEAAAALAPLSLERAERIGIVAADGADIVEPCLELTPIQGRLIASDPSKAHGHAPDHVLGVTPGTLVLDALAVRGRVGSALDLGTGSGLLALEAARHAEHTVALDINPRALRFVEFNAALNGAENVEVREGSMFEPVANERFDLVVCNPPYYISPESDLIFRDRGLDFCEQLVRELPGHLEDGGFGAVLSSWVHGDDEDWTRPLRRWVTGGGCDALLLRYRTWEPLTYAAEGNRVLSEDASAFDQALDRWLGYYAERGIERISWGAVVLRRRPHGESWVWAHEPSATKIDPAGDHLRRLFSAQDFLRRDADALMDETLTLAREHRIDQTLRLDGKDGAARTLLRLDGGLRFQLELDDSMLSLLARIDGSRPLRETLDGLDLGDGPVLAESALPAVARLYELGFLVRAGDERS